MEVCMEVCTVVVMFQLLSLYIIEGEVSKVSFNSKDGFQNFPNRAACRRGPNFQLSSVIVKLSAKLRLNGKRLRQAIEVS